MVMVYLNVPTVFRLPAAVRDPDPDRLYLCFDHPPDQIRVQ